jgi:DNA polymerase-3 subunit epsilon
MSLFSWLRPASPLLSADLQQRLAKLPTIGELKECSLREQRWVVLDLETTGLNLNKDRVLSIGAVVIEDGAIDFSQQFERTLQCRELKLSPSVLIHGLGPNAIAAGSDPAEALLELMEFIGDSPVLAFHAPFDQHMLGRALKEHWATSCRTCFWMSRTWRRCCARRRIFARPGWMNGSTGSNLRCSSGTTRAPMRWPRRSWR